MFTRKTVDIFKTFRHFASASMPSEEEIHSRVMNVIKQFAKVEHSKIHENAKFQDIGLDSLDQVELVIALEEEFKMELTDDVAENVWTPSSAVSAIKKSLIARQ